MTDSIAYTYGMFCLKADGFTTWNAGTVEYHNLLVIGLCEMEELGLIRIGYGSVSEPSQSLTIQRALEQDLPDEILLYEPIFKQIPEKEPITLAELVEAVFKDENTKEETDLRNALVRGMRERGFASLVEKKGLFGRHKNVIEYNPNRVQSISKELQDELLNTESCTMNTFILQYLNVENGGLRRIYEKEDAKRIKSKVRKLEEQKVFQDSTFYRIINIIREAEAESFMAFLEFLD